MSLTYGVVVCSYKYGHLAAHAIDSVLSQTEPFDKVWFVDDGAGDCQHLPQLYPQVEFVLREENIGTVANFQDMLERVDTDYVMFLGADNWLDKATLSYLKPFVDRVEPRELVGYDVTLEGQYADDFAKLLGLNEVFHYREFKWIWDTYGIYHGSALYSVKLAKEVGGYERNPNSEATEEDKMLFGKMIEAGANYTHVSKPLLHYRRHEHNHNRVK